MDICKYTAPTYREVDGGHFVACHLYNESMTQVVLQPDAVKKEAR